MSDIKKQKISIHIEYLNGMTLHSLGESLGILNEAFAVFSNEYDVKLSNMKENSPEIKSVSNGSFIVDIVIPVSCTLVPIIYDIIKRKFDSAPAYRVGFFEQSWSDEDEYRISKAVLEEYAVRKSEKSVEVLIGELSLENSYKKGSVKSKIQNTKSLMVEYGIPNTLGISGRDHYSSGHRIQFERACKELKLL